MTLENIVIVEDFYMFILGIIATVIIEIIAAVIVYAIYKILHIRKQVKIANNYLEDYRKRG